MRSRTIIATLIGSALCAAPAVAASGSGSAGSSSTSQSSGSSGSKFTGVYSVRNGLASYAVARIGTDGSIDVEYAMPLTCRRGQKVVSRSFLSRARRAPSEIGVPIRDRGRTETIEIVSRDAVHLVLRITVSTAQPKRSCDGQSFFTATFAKFPSRVRPAGAWGSGGQ